MNALKTLPAALVAGLTVLVTQGADVLPTWALVIVAALVAAVAVYVTPPAPGVKTPPAPARGQHGYANNALSIAIGVVVGGVVLWLLGLLVGRL